jgi:hypothetical protein
LTDLLRGSTRAPKPNRDVAEIEAAGHLQYGVQPRMSDKHCVNPENGQGGPDDCDHGDAQGRKAGGSAITAGSQLGDDEYVCTGRD